MLDFDFFAHGRQVHQPRLDGKTIDYTILLLEQVGDNPPAPFSFIHDYVPLQNRQINCYQTRTTPEAHELINGNLDKSIHIRETVRGPRYCPSIESKIIRSRGQEALI